MTLQQWLLLIMIIIINVYPLEETQFKIEPDDDVSILMLVYWLSWEDELWITKVPDLS